MGWNVSAEAIAFIIVLIISVYSGKSHAVPSTKNRIFKFCLITTLGAIGANLASTLMIAYAPPEIAFLTWLVTLLYFILTPLLGTVYFYYAVAVVSEARPLGRKMLILSALPCLFYFFIVVGGIWTGWLFSIDSAGIYHQGPLIVTTYVVFYFYCVACFALVVFTRAPIDPVINRILAVFPFVAVVVIAAQQAFPTYLLSGSAAACSLLIIYLYLQNKRLSIDSLTGTPNRQEFLSMIALMHEKQRAFTTVLVSLSNFKFINDKFGHENGDRFLREFSHFLKTQSHTAHLYRYSGDQFAFIIDEGDNDIRDSHYGETVKTLLETLQMRLEDAWSIAGHSYKVTAAVGVASCPSIVQDPSDMVAALEYTVTQAKKLGANIPCFCTSDMMNTIHRHSAVANIVREAVQKKSFTVNYQPVWSESAGRFVAAEALCRLTDTELGTIPPNEFIPIAEQTGLISDVTFLILEQVCSFISEYHTQHPNAKFHGVSVNFSAVQFIQNDLAEAVLEIVERHGIPASYLRIEITESTIITNPEVVHTFMEKMHEHGVLFYLDDFGTGYSNLSSLLEMPFDVIKVDKSILWSATEDGNEAEFLGYLASCFTSIGPKMLSEGVETAAQRAYLNRCGFDLMQGYLLARPLPPEEAAAVIAASEQDTK